MKSTVLPSTLILALCAIPVLAQDPEAIVSDPKDIVNFEWTIDLSRTPKGDQVCSAMGCFQPGDTIEISRQSTGYNFVLTTSGKPSHSFPAQVSVEYNQANPPEIEHLVALFEDDVACQEDPPQKALIITPVKIKDRLDQFSCLVRLARVTRSLFPEDLVRQACQNPEPNLVHWRIATVVEGTCGGEPAVRTLSPPDDGQGTGTGGN